MSIASAEAVASLLDRASDLKGQLVDFGGDRRFRTAFGEAIRDRTGTNPSPPERERINTFDYFLLQHILDDGRTVVDHFVEEKSELTAADRIVLLGWRDVVEGLFEVKQREGDALILHNLLDELDYRVHTNAGPAVLEPMRVGTYLMVRLVPLGDVWMMSGAQAIYGRSARLQVYRAAAQMALASPRLLFHNPEKLAKASAMQEEEHAAFLAFFGGDTIVVSGEEAPDRLAALLHYQIHEHRDAAGKTAADRSREDGLTPPTPAPPELPIALLAADTVGILSDPVDGVNILPDYGLVESAFANPDVQFGQRKRDAILGYLNNRSIIPLPLARLAERYPEGADRVFQQVVDRPDFSWARDGEALLREHKVRYYARPPVPGIAPLGDTLARALRSGAAARNVGRNDPCPCGSGKKFKRCCGAAA